MQRRLKNESLFANYFNIISIIISAPMYFFSLVWIRFCNWSCSCECTVCLFHSIPFVQSSYNKILSIRSAYCIEMNCTKRQCFPFFQYICLFINILLNSIVVLSICFAFYDFSRFIIISVSVEKRVLENATTIISKK